MKKLLLFVGILLSGSIFAEGAFLTMSLGPDLVVQKAENGFQSARFRLNTEIGSKNFAFLIQPSFGSNVSAVFVGARFMYPIPMGDAPLFVVPDFGTGVD